MIYQVRQVEAHRALGDINAALDLGHQIIDTIGGVDSARTTSALEEIRGQSPTTGTPLSWPTSSPAQPDPTCPVRRARARTRRGRRDSRRRSP
ncbi:hypothetical protein ACFRQM_15540 [Streptomyces sp. NPDC056831]|uniref:hypothetical protein n=1 Tax=Streptomyces sp. NPDC056831 TaxID=3345954 RepID=UPI0036AC490E